MEDRDKFLTEAMGECWHEEPEGSTCCPKCNRDNFSTSFENLRTHNFSTWQGFGKLWEWAQQQEWFEQFLIEEDVGEYIPTTKMETSFTADIQAEFIHPDRFANALYEFLKDRQ